MKTALDKVLIAICKEKQKIDYIELFSFDFNDFHFDYHGNYYGYGYFKTDPTKEYEYAWNNFDDMLNVPMKHVGKTMCEILNGLSENEIKLSMSYELENILLHRNILERLNSILKNKKWLLPLLIFFYYL